MIIKLNEFKKHKILVENIKEPKKTNLEQILSVKINDKIYTIGDTVSFLDNSYNKNKVINTVIIDFLFKNGKILFVTDLGIDLKSSEILD